MPALRESLYSPTATTRSLPDDVTKSILRVEINYAKNATPLILAVFSFGAVAMASMFVGSLLYGNTMPITTPFAVLVLLGLAGIPTSLVMFERADRKLADHKIIECLVASIQYIDANEQEWPDTAHKYKLSQYIDMAAQAFPAYFRQLFTEMTPDKQQLARRHMYGLASLKDEVSVSDQAKVRAVRQKLVGQLRLFTRGKWNQMLTAELPPKDKTTAPKRHLALQVLVVFALLCGISAVAWFYHGEWAGGVAAVALVIALVALVFMFVPKFADAFSAATAAFKGVKDVTPAAKGDDDSEAKESSESP